MSDDPALTLAPISLPELRRQGEPRRWRVDQPIADLPSLTPVRGALMVRHHGQLLEVEGRVQTIVTLCCDRCLQHFNHPLEADARELLELGRPGEPLDPQAEALLDGAVALSLAAHRPDPEGEVQPMDLEERLDPEGSFDPERWLFEQLSLQLPIVNRCGPECPGPHSWSSAASGGTPAAADQDHQPPLDPRWAALRQLQTPEPPSP